MKKSKRAGQQPLTSAAIGNLPGLWAHRSYRRHLTSLALLIFAFFLLAELRNPRKTVGQELPQIPLMGAITLEVLNPTCRAVSPSTADVYNPDPSDLNDGELDESEGLALLEPCILRAIAIAPNGMRLTGIPLVLVRAEASNGAPEVFGEALSTDARGAATWGFYLIPNTNFIFHIESPSPTLRTVTSNAVEIQLCTGAGSIGRSPGPAYREETGRGCP